MNKKLKMTGFTIVELLTVIAVLAILVGVLMPALNQAKKMARQTKQKAQLHSIDIGLNVYKNDQGSYPRSHGYYSGNDYYYDYCGAQTLNEALFGQDLLGFHPDSEYDYSDPGNLYEPSTLDSRKGPYLERENISVFKPGDMYSDCSTLEHDKFLICDVFTYNKTSSGEKCGKPVLYFRANTSATNAALVPNVGQNYENIYDYTDNMPIIDVDYANNDITDNKFDDDGSGELFYTYITDKKIFDSSGIRRPVRPDTFLLISAGYDGLYGTADDICNFEPNF